MLEKGNSQKQVFLSDFKKLWLGESVSTLGSDITRFALPLVAAQTLNASASQMGLLTALGWLPILFLGLFVGVWVDQRRRRPILIASDVLRALILLAIPLAAWLGWLSIPLLFVVTLLHGVLNVFALVASPAYLPSLVAREHISASNAKLELSHSISQVLGPSLAGLLTQIITAPFAIAFDAFSFAVSATCLSLIRTPEPAPAKAAIEQGPSQFIVAKVAHDIADGLHFLLRHRRLRTLLVFGIIINLGGGMTSAILVLFITRELGLDAVQFGIVMSAAGPGAIIAALVSARIVKHIGITRTILIGVLLSSPAGLVFPLLNGSILAIMTAIIISEFIFGFGSTLWGINVQSMRQLVTPPVLLGRVTASMRTLVIGTLPIGSVIGGLLGEWIGLRATLGVAACFGLLLASLALLSRDMRRGTVGY